MEAMNAGTVALLVCLCGGLGSLLRYAADVLIRTRWMRVFPLSTFLINVTACLSAGIVAGLAVRSTIPQPLHLMLAVGLLGGFSTLSTAVNEVVSLFRQLKLSHAMWYWLAQLIAPLAVCAGGMLLTLATA